MQRFQMSVKPSYNMTPNQRKMLAERRNADAEVVKGPRKKSSAFIFASIGVVVIAAIAGIFVAMNKGKKVEAAEKTLTVLGDTESTTENVAKTEVNEVEEPAPTETEVIQPEVVPAEPVKKEEPVYEGPTESTIKSINPNTAFAQNFFEKVKLIEPGIPESIKIDMLKVWAADVANISMKWRDFSDKAKQNARWGISRKASDIADDWGYLAELFSRDVKPDDREHLANLVSDIIKRETILRQQCEN